MTIPRGSRLRLALILTFAACGKAKSTDQFSQDKLLVRDADMPGAAKRVGPDGELKTAPNEDLRPSVVRSRESGAGSPCDSPRSHDQHACLKSLLNEYDARLQATYTNLISAIETRGEASGDRHEARAAVRRLRAAERQWLDFRDKECRRRTYETEGKLWARTRAKCLGEFSVSRGRELSQNLGDVRAGR